MPQPTLYLFVGAPGAGKTTTAQIISNATGAVHIWADAERHKRFTNPSHSQVESNELYEQLNAVTESLLKAGKSVVFDTNFNFYSDRSKLKSIADKYNARSVLIWMKTPEHIAKSRSVGTHQHRNGYTNQMSDDQFNAIVSKLEPPRSDESVIEIDGSDVTKDQILSLL